MKKGILAKNKERRERMFLNNLCVSGPSMIADLIVLAVIVIFCIVCGKKGFVNCLLGFISTIASVAIAMLLSKVVIGLTGGLFGLQDAMANGFESAFLKIKGFDTDISSVGIEAALKEHKIPEFLCKMIVDTFGNETVPQGTTIALLAAESVSGHAISLITWVLLFIVARLIFSLLKQLIGFIISKIKILGVANTVLGVAIGLIESLLIVYVVLAILSVIPVAAISTYIDGSLFVRWMYHNNLLNVVLGWIMT